jgi:uncharacterized protein (DUF58 family)
MRVNPAVAVGVLGVVVVSIGRVFGLLEMYVLGTGLVIVATLSVLTTRTRIVLVDIVRRPTSPEPRVGEEVGIELVVRALRHSPAFELSDRIVDSSASSIGRVDVSVPPLRRSQQTITRYRIRARRRGVITLGPAIVDFGDPLGLARRNMSVGRTDELIVSPEWVPIALPVPERCAGELVSAIEEIARTRSAHLEFRSLRDYAPGDDARFINWRASARRDVLIVNEFESHSGVLLDVFLDSDSSAFSPEGFERAVSVAASVVGSASQEDDNELRVRLSLGHSNDGTAFEAIIDDTTRRAAMRSLAMLDLAEREPRIHGSDDRSRVTVPVVICGHRNAAWLETVGRGLQSAGVAVVIACEGAMSVPDGWLVTEVRDFCEFPDHWAALSHRIRTT